MAEQILSPGVFQNESDQSLVQRGIQGTATAVVGPTVLGQPFVPTYVTSYSEYVSKFGETFKSGSYYYEYFTSMAARDFFQNGGQTLLVTKITNGSGSTQMSTYASASVISQTTVGSIFSTGSKTLDTSINNFMTSSNQEARIAYNGTTYRFIAAGLPLPQDDVDGNVYYFLTGSTAVEGLTSLTGSINRALSGSAASASVDIVRATAGATNNVLVLSGSLAGAYANGITLSTGSGTSFIDIITMGGVS